MDDEKRSQAPVEGGAQAKPSCSGSLERGGVEEDTACPPLEGLFVGRTRVSAPGTLPAWCALGLLLVEADL